MPSNNQRLNATIQIGGALASSFKNAIGSTRDQMRTVSQSVKKLTDRQIRLNKVANHWDKMGRDASEYRREIERINKELARQEKIAGTLRATNRNKAKRDELRGQLFDAVALGATLAAPIKVAADFEQQMANVGAVSKASSEDLSRLTKTARELGATTNWSATQAAEGMQFLSMAGFNTNQTIAAMPGMLDLASAGAIELGSAADIASNILSGFGMQAEEMGRLGDVLTNTFTSSNTSLQSLGETMKYVAPVAAATGVSLEQAAAMAGKLGDAGIQASSAGTALRSIINRLAAPVGKAATVLNDLGVQTTDASGNLREVPDILADLNKSMEGFGSAAKAEITSTIFGLEAASAATVLLGQAGTGTLQSYSEKLAETGSAARVAAQQNDTAMGAMRRLGSAVESIAISFGNILLPPLVLVADKTAAVVGVVDSLAQEFPTLSTAVVGAAAGLIALKVAAIAGGFAMSFIKGGILTATLAFTRLAAAAPVVVGAIRAVSVALMANPIGAIVGGIALAAGAIYTYWEPISGFFADLWGNVTSIAGHALEWFKDAFAWSPVGLVAAAWSPMVGFVANTFEKITGVVEFAYRWFGQALSWSPVSTVKSAWDGLTVYFSGLFDGIKSSVGSVLDWITNKLNWVVGKIEWAKNAIGGLVDGAGDMFSGVGDFFGMGDSEQPSGANAPAKLDTVTGRVEYDTGAPQPPKIGDVAANARYNVEQPMTAKLDTVTGQVSYDTEAPTAAKIGDISARARYEVETPTAPNFDDFMMPGEYQPAKNQRVADIPQLAKTENTTNNNQKTVNQTNNFTINQQPGQSAEDLAREIARIQAEQQRGALFDDGIGVAAYG